MTEGFFVARPAGVWDTRRPLNRFSIEFRAIRRRFATQIISRSTTAMCIFQSDSEQVEEALNIRYQKKELRKSLPWLYHEVGIAVSSYKAQHDFNGPFSSIDHINRKDFEIDLKESIFEILSGMLLRNVAIFEAFISCWTLNFILAKLEDNERLDKAERKISRDLIPMTLGEGKVIRAKEVHSPNWTSLKTAFRPLIDEMNRFNHRDRAEGPSGRLVSMAPLASVVDLVVGLRNKFMHSNQFLSRNFCKKHVVAMRAFESADASFRHEANETVRARISYQIVRESTYAIRRACEFLDYELSRISETRGENYKELQNSLLENRFLMQGYCGRLDEEGEPLLQEGDHKPSLNWIKCSPQDRKRQFLQLLKY